MEEERQRQINEISYRLIGAAIEVHRLLGPGLLESAYQKCLCREMDLREIPYDRQIALSMDYKGIEIECAYRMDIVVAGSIIVELKSVEALAPIHDAQLLTYLRLSGMWLGLLINFNVPVLKQGIRRIVNG